jgi:hypothetical protein
MSVIPLEIIREIVETAYYSEAPSTISRLHNLQDIGVSTKPAWTTLAGVSSTSHAYRGIALEVWFSTLRVACPKELEYVCQTFPRVSHWTR